MVHVQKTGITNYSLERVSDTTWEKLSSEWWLKLIGAEYQVIWVRESYMHLRISYNTNSLVLTGYKVGNKVLKEKKRSCNNMLVVSSDVIILGNSNNKSSNNSRWICRGFSRTNGRFFRRWLGWNISLKDIVGLDCTRLEKYLMKRNIYFTWNASAITYRAISLHDLSYVFSWDEL